MTKALIYLADDEPELLDVMKDALEASGYDVRAAKNGSELLAEVDRAAPDLILLDINMPGLTGWEVKEFLNERAYAKHVPVIAVTAQGGASVETSALATLGFTDFVRKPFKLADLLGRIEKALATRPAR